MDWLAWSLLSAGFAGLTAIFAKLGVEHVDPNLATAIRTTVIVVVAWLAAALSSRASAIAEIGSRTWIFLTLSGLTTAASWLCYFRALQIGAASRVAPIDKLSVVVAMVLAVLLLGESVGWTHWLGGLLIVAGAVLIATA